MSRIGYSGIGPASASAFGSLSPTQFAYIQNIGKAIVNLTDYGADPTGVVDCSTALTAAIAALPGGGIIMCAGTFKLTSTFTIATAGITLMGPAQNSASFVANFAAGDIFLVNQWYVTFQNLTITTSVPRTSGFAINAPSGFSYVVVVGCEISGGSSTNTHFNCVQLGSGLGQMEDNECRFFSNFCVAVNGQSDHRILSLICDNAVQAVSGIVVQVTSSLIIANCNIIHSGNALDIAPATGITIPSIECINTFFDTSTNGIRFNPAGTGAVFRCKFTNVWCSSHTGAGVLFAATGGGVDGITWVNCDFYGNVNGILVSATPSNWSVQASRFAGNTTAGINLIAGATHFPQIHNNQIGPVSAFGANATGIIIGAGTYAGLTIENNTVTGNTTNLTRGAVVVSNFSQYRITDNAGINPLQPLAPPTLAATTVATVNNTGLRCSVVISAIGVTATRTAINGVSTGALVAVLGQQIAVVDPGGSVTMAFGTAPTLVWIGN